MAKRIFETYFHNTEASDSVSLKMRRILDTLIKSFIDIVPLQTPPRAALMNLVTRTKYLIEPMATYNIDTSTWGEWNSPQDGRKEGRKVKKGQNLEQLTFVSYRLSCTEELYSKFMESSFWPKHVMIGEFIVRERVQPNVGDFISIDPNLPKNTQNTRENDDQEIRETPVETV